MSNGNHDNGTGWSAGDGHDAELEARINALIDGELSADEAHELKRQAEADPELAAAIVQAWRLQEGLETLRTERAPRSLTRRLKRIPRQRGAPAGLPRWVLGTAVGSVAVAAVAMVMMTGSPRPGPDAPRQAEVPAGADREAARQAARDLQIAFEYIDRIGLRTAREMQGVLDDELAEPVRSQLSRNLPYTVQNRKENHS